MSLKSEIKKRNKDIKNDSCLVAFWKTKNKWKSKVFQIVDFNLLEDFYVLSSESIDELKRIVKQDKKAIFLNGYINVETQYSISVERVGRKFSRVGDKYIDYLVENFLNRCVPD